MEEMNREELLEEVTEMMSNIEAINKDLIDTGLNDLQNRQLGKVRTPGSVATSMVAGAVILGAIQLGVVAYKKLKNKKKEEIILSEEDYDEVNQEHCGRYDWNEQSDTETE